MNTKRFFFLLAVAIMTISSAMAQRISVVSETGTTNVYRTLQDAIENALPGSTIYLPGGGFSIADSVKITKRLTIIGIGHKSDNENADGSTIISGNLWFNENSSGSAVMACFITGNVNIGENNAVVNDVTIKFCNLNSVIVKNSMCQETVMSQNYVRNGCNFGINYIGGSADFSAGASAIITNNIITTIHGVSDGIISNNIITGKYNFWYGGSGSNNANISICASNTTIFNNVFINPGSSLLYGSNCITYHNMFIGRDWGDYCINLDAATWDDVFENYNNGTVSPISKFHFKEAYADYEHQVGIYAGDSFNEDQMAPVPYIVAKDIPQQTDAAGNLNIKIRVKAN